MVRWWLGLLVGGVAACGSGPEPSPWDARAQVLPCGVQPTQCLTGAADAPRAGEVTRDSPSVTHYLAPDEYVGAASGCELAYVYDVPPENLGGLHLQIIGSWNESGLAPLRALERCADYDGTLHVYTPDAEGAQGFRLLDHRIYKAEANERSGLCERRIQSAGPGEPTLPRNEPILLTAPLYPEGLRIVVSALDTCEPLPLRFSVSEEFPSAGEPQPELGPQE